VVESKFEDGNSGEGRVEIGQTRGHFRMRLVLSVELDGDEVKPGSVENGSSTSDGGEKGSIY
jgi:hypothetical protein